MGNAQSIYLAPESLIRTLENQKLAASAIVDVIIVHAKIRWMKTQEKDR